ncbi:glycosyltransferase family 2 protein [Desulfopila sp. IMCC35008]|uniref:glycosyltransferase family 2 protein n=1 Tax=Desulfopila sp. IMCC35008 TaxID=2653858 RepID=UPI0013D796F0|nr:glycosyltransferase family 2 protein [Desulfopila sp. IMCC35008]
MQEDIKFSVVIPHYNSNFLIERALKSIPVNKDIQIIVIDDFSTEHSIRKIARKDEYSHVEFVFPDKKVTSGGARNIGIDKAQGEYVFFVDSDDYLAENAINIFNEISESKKDLYQFRAESFLEETGEIGSGTRLKHFLKYYEMENREGLLCILTPWGKLIRRGFLEENDIRFSEVPPNHGDDMFFSTQVAVHCKTFEFSKEIVYFVSQGPNNSTSSHNADCYVGLLKQTILCNQLIKKCRPINTFNFFKDIRNRRWIDIALQVNDQRYSLLHHTYLKSLPISVVLYWKYLSYFGKLQSPQFHFSSSRNIDICYVLRQGTRKKLIVNFNDFGSFHKEASEKDRYPYFFVNSYRKTKQSVLDLRDFWGEYGVYYLQHNGDKIDTDINECIIQAIRVLGINKNDVLLFGIGKGGRAAIHYSLKYNYANCIVIDPHSCDIFNQLISEEICEQVLIDMKIDKKYFLCDNDVKSFVGNGNRKIFTSQKKFKDKYVKSIWYDSLTKTIDLSVLTF